MGARTHSASQLFAAVVAHVGIYDMLRVELSPNGAFQRYRVRHREGGRSIQALYAYFRITT